MKRIQDKPGGRPAKKRTEKQKKVVSTKLTELQYYAIRTCVADNMEELEDLLRFLKRRKLTEADVSRYGGIVRL